MATNQIDKDPFDTLLGLEDDFYNAGYERGRADGELAGRIEGRSVGLKAGYQKYVAIGRLHGKAMIWAEQLPVQKDSQNVETGAETVVVAGGLQDITQAQRIPSVISTLPANPRLALHVKTLYALTEPGSLSTENKEDCVADIDVRLKRAEGKAKVIERLTGEIGHSREILYQNEQQLETKAKEYIVIEDISVLHARH